MHLRFSLNKGLVFLLVLLAAMTSGVVFQAWAVDSFDGQVVDLINAERSKVGLPALKISSKLTQAAINHNNTMNDCVLEFGLTTCFAHQVTAVNEPSVADRIKATGYIAVSWGEIIARGQKTPEAVVAAWMASSGHRANILTTTRVDIGCDFLDGDNGNSSRFFWTCDFGKSSSTTVSSTATPRPTTTATPKPTATATPKPTNTATPRPTATATPQVVSSVTPKPTSTQTPAPTAIPTVVPVTPAPTSFSFPKLSIPLWWCKYSPDHYLCVGN